MGHDHGAAATRAGERHRRPLTFAFLLIAAFFVVESIAAFWTNSLALASDAGHMLTDVLGLGMALAAIQLATRFEHRGDGPRTRHTFGLYRLEILAAFVNALLLAAIALGVIVAAVVRLRGQSEVRSGEMFIVAVLGLVVNVVAFLLLRRGAEESLNVEGAYLEVLADTVGSVGAILAAVAAGVGWWWADPVVAVAIGSWILPRTVRLGRRAARILLQSAPDDIDLDDLETRLASIEGVVDVHDLHVWTLTSEMEAASAHLVTVSTADTHAVLDTARDLLAERFHIHHATFQVEPDDHQGCEDVTW